MLQLPSLPELETFFFFCSFSGSFVFLGKDKYREVEVEACQKIVENLISNAINYNKENGTIDISAKPENGNLIFSVKDSGIGIEKEHIPRLCERFYRVDKSRSKKTGGTGLGLAIVKHVCALYGAELKIESEVGIGTTVTVKFINAT